ncbi:MAG: crossover junction endodeoxyribonuclease RuvC [Patescibacteria group bacterium]
MPKATIILGLDPGLADTGFGVLSKHGQILKFVAAGSIRTSPRFSFSRRAQEIYKEILSLIEQHRPDIVAVEKLFFAKNVKTALAVGQARGVVLLAIEQSNRQLVEFTPLQIKQAIAASGTASKKQVGLMVKSLLRLSSVPKPDDAADALAVAITAAYFNKNLV